MGHGVGRQSGGDEGDGLDGVAVVRQAGPFGDLLDGALAGEPGAAPRSAEVEAQLADRGGRCVSRGNGCGR